MAIVVECTGGRIYLSPTPEQEIIAASAKPEWKPETKLPDNPRDFKTPNYGMTTFGDLFTSRQLVALTTLSDLVSEVRERILTDSVAAGMHNDDKPLDAGGAGARAYAEAVSVYLGFCIDKNTLTNTTLASWQTDPDRLTQAFSRQALPMTWDFAEANPLSEAGGSFIITQEAVIKVLERLPCAPAIAIASQQDARTAHVASRFISTDPPYYDNIGYADLSDYFYVWLRRSLRSVFPGLLATIAVPKAEELVATPYRHGTKEKAERFFLSGMTQAIRNLAVQAHPAAPITIYYAFKQSETEKAGTNSTGWETFLEAVLASGFSITGTWPMRTELVGNLKKTMNALASSIILVDLG